MSVTTSANDALTWRLHGRPLRVAVVVAAVLAVGVLAAAAYDLTSPLQRRPVPLEVAALVCKLVIAAGLVAMARRTHSVSMWLLAGLAGLLPVASLLVGTTALESAVDGVAVPLSDVLPLSEGVVHNGLLFGALGLAALGLLGAAWLKARPGERQVVLTLILLFAGVGIFTGPVNAIAALGINREWLFAEDFGQAAVLAVMAGYVAGLVCQSAIAETSPGWMDREGDAEAPDR